MEGVEGEAHDVVVAAVDAADADAADPLLNAVSSCCVEGAVAVDICFYHAVAQSVEGDECCFGECYGAAFAHEGDARNDFMGFAGQEMKHRNRFVAVLRFAENLSVAYNHSISSNDNFVAFRQVCIR